MAWSACQVVTLTGAGAWFMLLPTAAYIRIFVCWAQLAAAWCWPSLVSMFPLCSSPSQAEMCGAVANLAFILTNNSTANCKERTNGGN